MDGIRIVRLDDAAEIAAIYKDYVLTTTVSFETEPVGEEPMRERIAEISSRFPYFVYEQEGRIVGYCYAHPWKERAAYANTLETTVYLSPDACGQGIGKQLMLRLIEACRQQGVHALIACITAENTHSIGFHASLGFRQVSLFRQVGYKAGRWLDVVDMELMLLR